MTLYSENRDWAQMIKHADRFVLQQGAADPKSKSNLFTLAMEGARQLGNTAKVNEYADRALTADPNNISVLMTMSRESCGKSTRRCCRQSRGNGQSHGLCAESPESHQSRKRPADADWQGTQGRLHGIIGLIYFNQSKWPEAGDELCGVSEDESRRWIESIPLRRWPCLSQLQVTLANLQALNNDAQGGPGCRSRYRGTYVERLEARNKEFETQRDITIDAMAKALP